DEGGLPGQARGLAFQLAENLGRLDWEVENLPAESRAAAQTLKRFGVRIGRRALFLPKLIRPAPSALAAMLWAVHARLTHVPSPPAPGLTSFALEKEDSEMPDKFLAVASFQRIGARAIRLDILERIEELLFEASHQMREADQTLSAIVSLLGSGNEDALALIAALGWKRETRQTGKVTRPVWQRLRKAKRAGKHRPREKPAAKSDSPFAGLAALIATD
ncbi:MAG TPA: hypothetical protein VNH44_03645, partial [Micropepsaceae bacterium]|nr:hypothetical protein [Micropepsaceae bacterium]